MVHDANWKQEEFTLLLYLCRLFHGQGRLSSCGHQPLGREFAAPWPLGNSAQTGGTGVGSREAVGACCSMGWELHLPCYTVDLGMRVDGPAGSVRGSMAVGVLASLDVLHPHPPMSVPTPSSSLVTAAGLATLLWGPHSTSSELAQPGFFLSKINFQERQDCPVLEPEVHLRRLPHCPRDLQPQAPESGCLTGEPPPVTLPGRHSWLGCPDILVYPGLSWFQK